MNQPFTYEKLQPWVDMLVDSLENKGGSSSGISNEKIYIYAQKYRDLLIKVRNKEISKYHLEQILTQYDYEIETLSNQKYRTSQITKALYSYFIKEFIK